MKKYLTGCIAVLLALSLSAFTASEKSSAASGNQTNNYVKYYWYKPDADGIIQDRWALQFGGPMSYTYAMQNDECWGGMGAECLRGFYFKLYDFPYYQAGDVITEKLPWD